MATEAQLANERRKRRELQDQLSLVEEMNGHQSRAYGARALKVALTAGSAATAGAISDVELGPVKLRWVNWVVGGLGAFGQVLTEPDGAGDVGTAAAAGMFYGQLGVSASGRKMPPRAGG